MRSKVQHHALLSSAQDHGVCESGQSRHDLDRPTTSIIQNTIYVTPPVDIPGPACDRTVNESGPQEDEDHGRNHAATFCHRTHDDSRSNSTELHLVIVSNNSRKDFQVTQRTW